MCLSYNWSFCTIKTCKSKDSACKECDCTNTFQVDGAHLIHTFTGVTLPVLLYTYIVIYIDTFKDTIKFPLKLVAIFKIFYYSHSCFPSPPPTSNFLNRWVILPDAHFSYCIYDLLKLVRFPETADERKRIAGSMTGGEEKRVTVQSPI
jgi:hypothetical protein